eukprot:CAMPEP_0119102340 /NCGR_PEP_ID=MMETSP1180-20130426/1109_1 /TAXON_ID=3052 ORGANISM="Chlamydomonas cf sp, Strain CCMP681" /NCGR_SAMPLE_ID=MMETSP1180 /ASSEMBLY_ACC=CAM_ASM_000741 /LENGTH=384 /DNA_ID=CAMNT_0007086601 /DNA_START=63 /DNA_END=1217 /DNA_ORIENTATION=-
MANAMKCTLPVLVALLAVALVQPSAAETVCMLSAVAGVALTGTCSTNGGAPTSITGAGSSGVLPGTSITYSVNANARASRFVCASNNDVLTFKASVWSDQTFNICEPSLLEIVGCSGATVANSTFTGITRNIAQPGGCAPSIYGPCIAVLGVQRQTGNWWFFSTSNTFTSVITDLSTTGVTRRGGAFALDRAQSGGKMNVLVVSSTFTSVSCDSGGGISATDADLTVRNSTWTSNLAVNGGCIHFQSLQKKDFLLDGILTSAIRKISLERSTFTTGTANNQGGLVAVYRGNVSISGSTFTQGEAPMGECVWLNECASYTKDQIVGNTWTECSTTFTTWCQGNYGNVWTSCGVEGPPECSTQFPSPPSPPPSPPPALGGILGRKL